MRTWLCISIYKLHRKYIGNRSDHDEYSDSDAGDETDDIIIEFLVIKYCQLFLSSSFVDVKFLLKIQKYLHTHADFFPVSLFPGQYSVTTVCIASTFSYKQPEDYLKYMGAALEPFMERTREPVDFGIHRDPRTSTLWILRLTVSCDLALSTKSLFL